MIPINVLVLRIVSQSTLSLTDHYVQQIEHNANRKEREFYTKHEELLKEKLTQNQHVEERYGEFANVRVVVRKEDPDRKDCDRSTLCTRTKLSFILLSIVDEFYVGFLS